MKGSSQVLLVYATPEFYADPAVKDGLLSFADLFMCDGTSTRLQKLGRATEIQQSSRNMRKMLDGTIVGLDVNTLLSQHKAWAELNGGGAGAIEQARVMSSNKLWMQVRPGTPSNELVTGTIEVNNPLPFFMDRYDYPWRFCPTLVGDDEGGKNVYRRAFLSAAPVPTIARLHRTYFHPDSPVSRKALSMVSAPLVFPCDRLDLTKYAKLDKRMEHVLIRMSKLHASDRDRLDQQVGDLTMVLEYKRKGKSIYPDHAHNPVFVQELVAMTPRQVASLLEKVQTQRVQHASRFPNDLAEMATTISALSHLLVARLWMAVSLLMMQVNQLSSTESTTPTKTKE